VLADKVQSRFQSPYISGYLPDDIRLFRPTPTALQA
jgi:hypothetical protein